MRSPQRSNYIIMNKETVVKMKIFYENAISNKMVEVLGANPNNVTASWSAEETKVRVDMTNHDNVVIYGFSYKDNNLTVEMESYKVLFSDDKEGQHLTGIQSKSCSVDVNTMVALQNIFKETLEQEYVEEVEEMEIAPEEVITDENNSSAN